jgi:ribosomal protein L37AE/L43A
MATDNESFNRDLYDLLKVRGYQPVPLDSKNQRVPASQAADVIQFTFTKDGEDYGKVWVSIDDAQNVIVYYDEEQQESPSNNTPGVEYDDSWTGFLKHLKNWSQRRQLSFELSNKDRLGDDMRQRDYYKMKERVSEGKSSAKTDHFGYEIKGNKKPWGLYHTRPNKPEKLISKHHNKNAAEAAKWDQLGMGSTTKGEKFTVKKIPEKQEQVSESQEPTEKKRCGKCGENSIVTTKKGWMCEKCDTKKVDEGYHPMGKKASYNDAVPSVKIILQHNRALEEGEQRYRNVAKIFLENQEGERFLAPTTRPGIARVYARHIAEGGVPNDDRWNHVKSVVEDYNKMAGFVRATRNNQFNESAQELVNEGINHYKNLRETLSKLAGHRGYQAYFESWTPTLMEDDGDDLSINELFVQETVDPRIESAMPILSRLKKPVTEMEEVDTLAEWADSIINEKLDLDEPENNVVPLKRRKPSVTVLAKDFDDEFGHYDELGRIGKLASINRGAEDDMDWDDDSWIPDEEDFEDEEMAKELSRHRKRFAANDIDETSISMSPQAVAEEQLDEVGGIPSDFMHSLTSPVRDLTRKGGAKKALRKVVPGLGKREAGERAKDEKFHAALMKTATPTYYDGEENPDYEKEVRSGKASEKAAKRYSNIAKGEKPFDEGLGDTIKKGVKSLKRGMKGWEKGMHDVDTVKSATKTLSPDDKERLLKDKVSKGSPAELQQKLIKREKNKPVEEDLDANQKRVGQLGPTEKVKNNNIGKLVGASESTEIDPELARIIEMAKFKR